MKEISVSDVRRAIIYVRPKSASVLQDLNDEQVCKIDLFKDLHIGNVRLINIAAELQRTYNFVLSWDVLRKRKDDTVGTFLDTVNQYLSETTD